MERKRRTRGHIIADIGVRFTEYVIAKAGYTSVQAPPGGDYGVDLYYFSFDADGLAENGAVRVQVRATESLHFRSDRSVAVRVDCRHLRYWLLERLPVLLVVYDATRDTAFVADVQASFRDRQVAGKSMSISLSMDAVFDLKCVQDIAARKNERLRIRGDPIYED